MFKTDMMRLIEKQQCILFTPMAHDTDLDNPSYKHYVHQLYREVTLGVPFLWTGTSKIQNSDGIAPSMVALLYGHGMLRSSVGDGHVKIRMIDNVLKPGSGPPEWYSDNDKLVDCHVLELSPVVCTGTLVEFRTAMNLEPVTPFIYGSPNTHCSFMETQMRTRYPTEHSIIAARNHKDDGRHAADVT